MHALHNKYNHANAAWSTSSLARGCSWQMLVISLSLLCITTNAVSCEVCEQGRWVIFFLFSMYIGTWKQRTCEKLRETRRFIYNMDCIVYLGLGQLLSFARSLFSSRGRQRSSAASIVGGIRTRHHLCNFYIKSQIFLDNYLFNVALRALTEDCGQNVEIVY